MAWSQVGPLWLGQEGERDTQPQEAVDWIQLSACRVGEKSIIMSAKYGLVAAQRNDREFASAATSENEIYLHTDCFVQLKDKLNK